MTDTAGRRSTSRNSSFPSGRPRRRRVSSPEPAASPTPTFAECGVAAEIVDGLAAHGITHTFAIQELTLPIALTGRDIIGQARTGMGKTLAFGVPLLDRIFDDADIEPLDGTPRALVIAPTRELAFQVAENLEQAASKVQIPLDPNAVDIAHTPTRPLTISVFCGGNPIDDQLHQLEGPVDVVVGTPGRLLDLSTRIHTPGESRQRRGGRRPQRKTQAATPDTPSLHLDRVRIVVLDEADEMLDLGFLPDIEKLLGLLPEQRQSMLFSATMPDAIVTLARSMMHTPLHIRAEAGEDSATHETTKQIVFRAYHLDKVAILSRVLQARDRGRTMIFTRTKREARFLAEDLAKLGFRVATVHGDLDQKVRMRSLDAFRNDDVQIVVATDVAARGIDVDDVTHVVNYSVPDDEHTYVHRIGRTGRKGKTGTAITFVTWGEEAKWEHINTELGLGIPEPPEMFSTSPELLEMLDIPASARDKIGPPREVFGHTSSAPRTGMRKRTSAHELTARSKARRERMRRESR